MNEKDLWTSPLNSSQGLFERLDDALAGARPVRMASRDGLRLLIDRDLPFLFAALGREPKARTTGEKTTGEHSPSESTQPELPQLARRIASAGAVHLIWNRDGRDDRCPEHIVERIGAYMQRRFETPLLLIELIDIDDPIGIVPGASTLPPFEITLRVSDLPAETGALAALERSLKQIKIDHRSPTVKVAGDWPRNAKAASQGLVHDSALARLPRIAVELPAIHIAADRSRRYPELLQRMESAVIDASLRAAWAYARTMLDPVRPASRLVEARHHRALGRRALDAAARTVDRNLTAIASAYELLLDLTPVNTAEAEAEFLASGGVAAPSLRYRPLSVSPGELKRSLYSINIGRIEDPVLENLFYEKQREIDQQLTLLQLRGSPRFRDASRVLYGSVSDGLLATARAILADLQPLSATPARLGAAPLEPRADAVTIAAAAEYAIAGYRAQWPGFDARIEVRDDLPGGLMVSGSRLLISSHTRMSAQRLPSLLEHEIGVHLLTYFNGDSQGLRVFRSGLAGYERIQEGLAVFAEFATGGTGLGRMRVLAARVLAVHAMQAGATFVETTRLLRESAGLALAEAFNVTVRVYRSGGLSKDAIYLQGLQQVLQYLAGGGDLDLLWLGKIAAHHISVAQELVARGMLAPPRLRPSFTSTEAGRQLIARVAAGTQLRDLIKEEAMR